MNENPGLSKNRTHHPLFPEVDADSGDELGVELVVRVAVQEGGLPHARVPQGQELYQVVIIPISHSEDFCRPAETETSYNQKHPNKIS